MTLHFREDRATQAAARFLELRGGKMNYMKLLKLLYMADRKALVEMGRPITYDRYVSMDNGPVLSSTYRLISEENSPNRPSYWREYISPPSNYDVSLIKPAPNGELSRAQEAIIDSVFKELGHRYRWDIVEMMHRLPEWRDPDGGALPIDLHTVLLGAGVNEEDARAIEDDLLADGALQSIAG